MFLLITNTTGPLEDRVNVFLDIGPADFDNFTEAVKDSVAVAKRANRKVGCIVRTYGGETWFTYAEAVQAQLEVQLIAAHATPHTAVQVNCHSGGEQ
jgi:hypothetical protein